MISEKIQRVYLMFFCSSEWHDVRSNEGETAYEDMARTHAIASTLAVAAVAAAVSSCIIMIHRFVPAKNVRRRKNEESNVGGLD